MAYIHTRGRGDASYFGAQVVWHLVLRTDNTVREDHGLCVSNLSPKGDLEDVTADALEKS